MNKVGQIIAKNIKTLVTGRSSILGTALSRDLIKNNASIYTVDLKVPLNLNEKNEQFMQGNVADETFLKNYLRQIGPVDAFVNCAAVRKSYNYYLSYLLSKNLLEKMEENDINEFGCRGCIINLVHLSTKYDEKYFQEQDEFGRMHNIDSEKIDDEVYALADRLTAARIRCNTILINDESDPHIFSNLVKHIIEDQYVAGQVINMEDDLETELPKLAEILEKDLHQSPKIRVVEEKYQPPKEIKDKSVKPLSLPQN